MQSFSLINQFLSNFNDLRYSQSSKTPSVNEDVAARSDSRLNAGVTVELSYSSTELAYSGSANGYSFSVQMMESRLNGQIQSFSRISEPPKIFESSGPSPETVANRILGFVENRIAREAQAGVSGEQLSKLFAEGLAGVNQGYGEAIEEIDQQGLLTDELSEEIDAGYTLIEKGFDALKEKFLGNSESEKILSDDPVSNPGVLAVNGGKGDSDDKSEKPAITAEVTPEQTNNSPFETLRRTRLAEALALSQSQYAANDVGINLTTRDGDKISIQVGQLNAQSDSLGYVGKNNGQSFSYSSNVLQLENLNLQVEGNLDDGELKALESLLIQVEDIASSFFNGDLDQAFAAALEMEVDMSEIASYAVSMTSLRYQAVESAYQQRPAEAGAFKPLANLVPQFAGALADASDFAQPKQLVKDLIDRMLQSVDKPQIRNSELFSEYKDRVIDKLIY